jgi:hypothetical protein
MYVFLAGAVCNVLKFCNIRVDESNVTVHFIRKFCTKIGESIFMLARAVCALSHGIFCLSLFP